MVELGGTTVVGNIQADCLYFCEAKTTGFFVSMMDDYKDVNVGHLYNCDA